MTHLCRIQLTTAHLPRRRILPPPMQPIAYQSPDSRFRQQQRNGPPLRFRLRDETRLALAACHPMPVFDRLSPFITPEQLADIYRNFTSTDVSELLPLSSTTTQTHGSSLWDTEDVVSSLTSGDQRKTSRVTDAKKCVQYPAFALVSQKNAELLNALPVSHNGRSSMLSSSTRTPRWRFFRRFLCMRASGKQAASSIHRNGTTVRQSSLMASSHRTKYSAVDLQSENFEGWIASGQEDGQVAFSCLHSEDSSIGSSLQAPSHKSSGSSSSSHCLSFVSAPSHELKIERALSMQYRSIRN